MKYWMGIDGGGSTIRCVVVDDTLAVMAQVERAEGVNPSRIGHDAAKTIIQDVMRQMLAQSGVEINGVGIGIAGAAASHSEAWLREVVAGVLPDVFTVASSDMEIALVGAMGERRGILLLCGTGSVVFGINDEGESKQVGGWGYLIGDEGSGYWLGLQAIRIMTQWADGRGSYEPLARRVMAHLNLSQPRDVLPWIYQQPTPVNQIASCAPLILEAMTPGSQLTLSILGKPIGELTTLVRQLRYSLNGPNLPIAFAGSLLSEDNPLSLGLCEALKLSQRPISLYSPVIGAALLAKLQQDKHAS